MKNVRSQERRWTRAGIAGAALGGFLLLSATCQTAKSGGSRPAAPAVATPSAVPTQTSPTPEPSPMPVTTPSSPSIYDRTPGVIYEEKGPPPPTSAAPSPTHQPRRTMRVRSRPTPTRTPTAPPRS